MFKFDYEGQEVVIPGDENQNTQLFREAGGFANLEFLEYLRQLRLKGTYVDIGAAEGNVSLYCGLFSKADKVLSVVGKEGSIPAFSESIKANELSDKIDILKCNFTNATLDEFLHDQESISVVSIVNYDSPSFLLKSLKNTIHRCKPIVFVGVEDDEERNIVSGLLESQGYISSDRKFKDKSILEFTDAGNGHKKYFDVGDYWDSRYRRGGNSGAGSYGRLAKFKAEFLNKFVHDHNVQSVIELGCGDGSQVALADYLEFIGLDISPKVIEQCQKKFEGDAAKVFETYNPEYFDPGKYRCELSLSLDVIYHLSNDEIYKNYLKHLFSASSKYVIIYSNSTSHYHFGTNERAEYVRFRDVKRDIGLMFDDWQLVDIEPNQYPFNLTLPNETSFADFYIYQKSSDDIKSIGQDSWVNFYLKKISRQIVSSNEQVHSFIGDYKNQKGAIDKLNQSLDKTFKKANEIQSQLKGFQDQAGTPNELKEKDEKLDELNRLLLEKDKELNKSKEAVEDISEDLRKAREDLAGKGIERQQCQKDLGDKDRRLRQLHVKHQALKKDYATIKRSLSFRLGHRIVAAFREPGRNTVLLPFAVVKEVLRSKKRGEQQASTSFISSETDNKKKDRLELSEKPIRLACDVSPGVELKLKVNSLYQPVEEKSNNYHCRKGLIVVQFNGKNKQVVDPGGQGLAFSEKIGSWFKYLPDTKGEISEALRLVIPEAVESVVISLQGFQLHTGEKFKVNKLLLSLSDKHGIHIRKNGWLIEAGNLNQELIKLDVVTKTPVAQTQELEKPEFNPLHKSNEGTVRYAGKVREVSSLKHDYLAHYHPIEVIPTGGSFKAAFTLRGAKRFSGSLIQSVEIVLGRGDKQDKDEGFTPPSALAQELGILGWPEYPDNGRPVVIAIMDEFTTDCFSSNLNLIQPRPDNWYALAEKYKPDLVFIESAWQGNKGSWQYRVGQYSNTPGRELQYLCDYANARDIPVVFWNKEDPVHHEKFMNAARLSDQILTSDANMIDSYKEKTGNANVMAMPFAAEPSLHKPKPLSGRRSLACFAGSWYGNRHAERGEKMRWLLESALDYGLEIYDRNYGTGAFSFPEKFDGCIKGSLPYRDLCARYGDYRVFLNVNSVEDSPTMFSRRVFELMASGTPVVSTYARGIDELFHGDPVWLVGSEAEAREAVQKLLNDDAEWRRRSLLGIREVFHAHTYAHRINVLLETLGINKEQAFNPSVTLFAEASSKLELQRLYHFANTQTYPEFELNVAIESGLNPIDEDAIPSRITLVDDVKSGRLGQLAEKGDMAGWINPGKEYFADYLIDIVNATRYAPGAEGWGVAYEDTQRFSLGGSTRLDSSLWTVERFKQLTQGVTLSQPVVEGEWLYCLDSDQLGEGK